MWFIKDGRLRREAGTSSKSSYKRQVTHIKDGRVVWHFWWFGCFISGRPALDSQVFHVTPAENDIFVDIFGRPGNVLTGSPAFRSVGDDLLKSYRGIFRVDFM